MKRPDQREQSGSSFTAWLPVLAAVAIMATGCVSTFLVLELDEFRPKVGDIVVFRPNSQDNDTWQMAIPATVVPAMGTATSTCTLDPNVMAAHGGSLVVEGRRNEPVMQYQVHWGGSETAREKADCGSAANLLISRTDLQRLANAAGGFGVQNKGIAQ